MLSSANGTRLLSSWHANVRIMHSLLQLLMRLKPPFAVELPKRPISSRTLPATGMFNATFAQLQLRSALRLCYFKLPGVQCCLHFTFFLSPHIMISAQQGAALRLAQQTGFIISLLMLEKSVMIAQCTAKITQLSAFVALVASW